MLYLWENNLTQAELEEYETLRVVFKTIMHKVTFEHPWYMYGHMWDRINGDSDALFFSVLLTINYPDAERFYELCKKAYGEDVVVTSTLLVYSMHENCEVAAENNDPEEFLTRKKA